MFRKTVLFIAAISLLLSFSACSSSDKDLFTSENGFDYIVVRDSDGNIVINDSNKLQVYTLNENGKKQKSDSGDYMKEYIDFNGQVVIGNTAETAEMKFEIPKTFDDNSDIPGYFYSETYEGDIYFTYYDESIEKHITAAEENCENLLESFGSEVFEYEKYSVVVDGIDCTAIRIACTSSEYYKNSYQYFIPYDTGFYAINCVVDTGNAKKVDFDKFVEEIILK